MRIRAYTYKNRLLKIGNIAGHQMQWRQALQIRCTRLECSELSTGNECAPTRAPQSVPSTFKVYARKNPDSPSRGFDLSAVLVLPQQILSLDSLDTGVPAMHAERGSFDY